MGENNTLTALKGCVVKSHSTINQQTSISAIYHKPFSQLLIFRNWEQNPNHHNELKAVLQRSCTENSFTRKALVNPSGTVYQKFKLFEIVANLSQFLSDL